jgi:4-carboxymuconolactone decarboxylase
MQSTPVAAQMGYLDESGLDEKTHALVRIAGLIAIDAAPPSYMWSVEEALRHGATNEELVGTLIAILPAVGSGRVVSAAPKLSLALGYDVAAGLEEFGVERA